MKKIRLLFLAILFLSLPLAVFAQERRCLICHAKKDLSAKDASGKARSLYVSEGTLTGSAHGKLACVDCHLDALEIPHQKTAIITNLRARASPVEVNLCQVPETSPGYWNALSVEYHPANWRR